jgi:hypothetical protein
MGTKRFGGVNNWPIVGQSWELALDLTLMTLVVLQESHTRLPLGDANKSRQDGTFTNHQTLPF